MPSERPAFPTATERDLSALMNKVPQITLYFWVIKIMATTVGETGADYLIFNMHIGLRNTAIIMAAILAAILTSAVRAKTYRPWLYWLCVVMVSIVGTLISDYLVDAAGVPLQTTTIIFAIAMLATFAAWWGSERTLSIHTIFTTRRELFYWAAILCTFALGTAAGDWIAEGLGWGYGQSALIFGGLIAAIALAHVVFRLDAILAFWLAYILTRPLGASLGDLLTQSSANGGLGLGPTGTTVFFLVVIVALVTYLSISGKDRMPAAPMPSRA